MKRRKDEVGNGPAKRKAKREVADRGEEAGKSTAEERGDKGEREAVAVEAERLADWEEGTRWWSVVDEQMSWGSFWCPSWDIDEYLGEAYNDASYGDVVWDYDIWDLGGINEVALFLEKIAMKRRKDEAGNGLAMRKAKREAVDRGEEGGKSIVEERVDEGEREAVAVEAETLADWEEGTRW
ncbi:hypothetical protein RHSIM_Rhsim09G0107900 [Rhododendron simsii]|uniref:Uncharacterized protein n=1 Tax=Rhododendron simsii TaxID=118357 RepID=A0A834GGW2_RHOSS|nr:hypothetical protein RHSIM_Rhsim09G0107900 [Rhododendron simsii]